MQTQKNNNEQPLKLTSTESLLAGATSGLLTRTCVAPLDVLKVRFQLQVNKGQYYRSIPHAVYRIARDEGPLALWKGNLVASLMSSPYSAITFSTQNALKHIIFQDNNGPFANAIAGGLAGCVATGITYPLDLLRSRFIAQHGKDGYQSLFHAIKSIYQQQGLRGYFEGVTPGLLGIFPYMAVQFAVYEGLKTILTRNISTIHNHLLTSTQTFINIMQNSLNLTPETRVLVGKKIGLGALMDELDHNKQQKQQQQQQQFGNNNINNIENNVATNNNDKNNNNNNKQNQQQQLPLWVIPFVGFVSGSAGKAISFPMDLLKRRMQMHTFTYTFDPQARPDKQQMFAIIRKIFQTEGFFAFYKGLIPSLLKSGPSASLTFVFYEACSRLLLKLRPVVAPVLGDVHNNNNNNNTQKPDLKI